LFLCVSDNTFDAYFILPPASGSVQVLKDYITSCEARKEKFVMSFEYVWIFLDASKKQRSVK
jgi:hypothetical protein